jgi:hypothetical protein
MNTSSLTRVIRLVALLIFVPYTVTFGDSEGTLTVYNETLYFIHVIMNNDSYLYVGPGRSSTFATDEQTTVHVQVFYAPGQGIEGSAQNNFVIGGNVYKSDCTSGTNTCSTDPEFASASWTITPDTLVAELPSRQLEETAQ